MHSMRRFRGLSLALLVTITLLAFGSQYVSAQTSGNDQVEEGARLYTENCAVCHGPDGQGRVGATLAKDWPSIRPDLRVKTTIENGIAGSPMPAWGQSNGGPLSESEIDALVAYILTWETGGPPEIPTSPAYAPRPPITPVPQVEGDPNRGGVLYDENCQVCHGPNGEGRIGARLAKAWVSTRPDLEVKNTISTGIEGTIMPAWSQSNGGPLTEGEINDLVAFVLSRPQAANQAEPTQPSLAPFTNTWFTGWGGAVLLVVLFIVVVGVAVLVQTRH
jgi:mono/diheme cytochrome c family protein